MLEFHGDLARGSVSAYVAVYFSLCIFAGIVMLVQRNTLQVIEMKNKAYS